MAVYKDNATNTWRAVFRYTDWQGNKKQTQKRGFPTKREAQAWEREQLNKTKADLDMSFSSFIEIYSEDMKSRIKENTWLTKEHIIRTKILPYFQNRKICDIQPKDVIAWQNEMINHKDKNGKPYSPVYLKTLHNQLSAIFNHAVKYYGLSVNPAAKVGNMGKSKNKEMQFWTQEEYRKFADVMMDKPRFYYAFEMLYWCGVREGELLALTPADFDFEKGTVSITKSYQRLKGRDVITDPKTVPTTCSRSCASPTRIASRSISKSSPSPMKRACGACSRRGIPISSSTPPPTSMCPSWSITAWRRWKTTCSAAKCC